MESLEAKNKANLKEEKVFVSRNGEMVDKRLTTKIGSEYYLKTDPDIVRVDVNLGKPDQTSSRYRYFRVNSPLICMFHGEVYLKSNTVDVEGYLIPKGLFSRYAVILHDTGEVALKKNTVFTHDGKYYRKGDKRIFYDIINDQYASNEEMVVLGYDSNNRSTRGLLSSAIARAIDVEGRVCVYTSKSTSVCDISGKRFFNKDMDQIEQFDDGVLVKVKNVYYNLKDKPKLKYYYTDIKNGIIKYFTGNPNIIEEEDIKSIEGSKPGTFLIRLNGGSSLGCILISDYIWNQRDLKERSSLKSRIIKNYTQSLNEFYPPIMSQNNPVFLNSPNKTHNGGECLYRSIQTHKTDDKSQTNVLTGGINYTFGIEYETAIGDLLGAELVEAQLDKMSDGSLRHNLDDKTIQGYEFVSKVMHGDKGVRLIKDQCDLLSKNTVISSLCSTHIHIGGKNYSGRSSDIPVFNREFSAKALVLGSKIEDELFDIIAKERKGNRYCASISPWGKSISKPFKDKKNKKNKHANYCSSLIDFIYRYDEGDLVFSREINNKNHLNRWTKGRYYWLNLVNCSTDNTDIRRGRSFSTIEFRCFPASHDFNDMYFYLLLSMSFVWFVENRPSKVMEEEISIEEMMIEATRGANVHSFIKKYIKSKKK